MKCRGESTAYTAYANILKHRSAYYQSITNITFPIGNVMLVSTSVRFIRTAVRTDIHTYMSADIPRYAKIYGQEMQLCGLRSIA